MHCAFQNCIRAVEAVDGFVRVRSPVVDAFRPLAICLSPAIKAVVQQIQSLAST